MFKKFSSKSVDTPTPLEEFFEKDPQDFILEKLSESSYSDKFNDNELIFLSKVLSNKNRFKKVYLNTSWKNFIKEKETLEIEIKDQNLSNIQEGFQDSFSNEIIEKMKQEDSKNFHVKLVIVEIMNTKTSKVAQKIISPILNSLNYSPDFGIFHTALMFVL
jgi:glycerophosphoryl diester phosphodiesterase